MAAAMSDIDDGINSIYITTDEEPKPRPSADQHSQQSQSSGKRASETLVEKSATKKSRTDGLEDDLNSSVTSTQADERTDSEYSNNVDTSSHPLIPQNFIHSSLQIRRTRINSPTERLLQPEFSDDFSNHRTQIFGIDIYSLTDSIDSQEPPEVIYVYSRFTENDQTSQSIRHSEEICNNCDDSDADCEMNCRCQCHIDHEFRNDCNEAQYFENPDDPHDL